MWRRIRGKVVNKFSCFEELDVADAVIGCAPTRLGEARARDKRRPDSPVLNFQFPGTSS